MELVACRLDSTGEWRRPQGPVSVLSCDGSCPLQGPQRPRSHGKARTQCCAQPARLRVWRSAYSNKTCDQPQTSVWAATHHSLWSVLLYFISVIDDCLF